MAGGAAAGTGSGSGGVALAGDGILGIVAAEFGVSMAGVVGGIGAISAAAGLPAAMMGGEGWRTKQPTLADAKRALATDDDFRRYFHREYKGDQGMGGGGSTNPNLDDEQVLEAYIEWLNAGRPSGY